MSAFGRLQAALAAATNEVTVAAANINFDFTLIKYEAPKEFRPIERFLTTTRKQDAEAGRAHIVARRLGALFEGVCPETPNLIKAYGARVSEISKTATQQESQEYSKSIFASYIGVDATSIWAAATSSKTAIHVHLLACMLAELWDAPEATSIWVELVLERRKDIAHRLEQGEAMHFGLASAAAQHEITRDQLAAWDASARAWIQTGRSVMTKNDTQLRLILQNVYFAINPSEAPFVSVIDAWKLALETTEKLVLGIPQEAQNGAAILGLSAWHIYPDIHVYGNKNVQVNMDDALVRPGGILSLASCPSHRNEQRGVYWSLCLSHLRFYGPPVQKHQTLEKDPRRISFENLLHGTVGAILSRWRVSSGNLNDGIKLLIATFDAISVGNPSLGGCMRMIVKAANECLTDGEALKYLSYGKRRSSFIQDPDLNTTGAHRAFFGLCDLPFLLSCIPELDARISLLRRLARRVDLSDQEVIIFDREASVGYDITPQSSSSSNRSSSKRQKKTPKEIVYKNVAISGTQVFRGRGKTRSVFDFWTGDPSSTGIFKKWIENGLQIEPPALTFDDLKWCFDNSMISAQRFVKNVDCRDTIFRTILILYYASKVFATLSRSFVRIQTLGTPLLKAHWADASNYWKPRQQFTPIDQCRDDNYLYHNDFQVLAHLISGQDIHGSSLPSRIMGLSFEDSIYVPTKLVHDPGLTMPHLTQILGNVGHPGVVILVPTAEPMLAPMDEGAWKIANMNTFDGKFENMLSATSLHLQFTNWSQPLSSAGASRNQDAEGCIMEAVVSIKDSGQWVGGVDIIKALESDMIHLIQPNPQCGHALPSIPSDPMHSIECWDELRDCPEEQAVVRASGNWVARLAATAYLAQKMEQKGMRSSRIFICPKVVCWTCQMDESNTGDLFIY